jgi:hypothetical protein
MWQALRGQLQTVLSTSPNIYVPSGNIFIDTPPSDLIGNLARGNGPYVHIFDLKTARPATRWPVVNITQTHVATGLISTCSETQLVWGGSQTITLSGPILPGDAVSCILQGSLQTFSVCVTAGDTDTLDTLATALALAISTELGPTVDNILVPWTTATAAGAVVTIQNITNANFGLFSFTGNNGVQITEWGRFIRGTGITLWTQTQAQRDLIAPLIHSYIMQTQNAFGFQCPDGTWNRLMYNNDMPGRDDKNNDVYRWNFLVDVEMGVTTQDILYQILGTTIVKVVSY